MIKFHCIVERYFLSSFFPSKYWVTFQYQECLASLAKTACIFKKFQMHSIMKGKIKKKIRRKGFKKIS